jgi:hypothetical protein
MSARQPLNSWLVLLGLLLGVLVGCTPISKVSPVSESDAGPDGSAADGGELRDAAPRDADGGGSGPEEPPPPKGEACSTDGAMRCAGNGNATRQREVCQGEFWMPAAECGEGEICTVSGGNSAACLGVASICRGNPGAVVCDAKGVLYQCGPDGVIKSSESCPSARHCQVGLAGSGCASCVPGEFRCQADKLERCDSAGMKFTTVETCAAGSCDASGGVCRGKACAEKRSVCRADVLFACAPGETELKEVERCKPGLCNASTGACDACLSGQAACDGETSIKCATDGKKEDRKDCSLGGGHCVGAGNCVSCARDGDCPDPGACKQAFCNLAKGTCEPQQQITGTACASGVCSANGACVSCNTAADCPAPGDCEVKQCDAAGSCKPKAAPSGRACGNGGKCDGSGHCASCVADGDCPEPPACQVRHCDTASGSCQPAPAPKGARCEAGVCDGSGNCAGCNADADCPAVGACQQKFCNPSTRVCEPKPAADGGSCNAAFGAGSCLSGECVQCANDAACRTAGTCQEAFCRTSDNTCQQRPQANGADCGGGKVCDGVGRCVECTSALQCGANATCVSSACRCNPGFVANPTGEGCNLDDCAKTDDNRCGADGTTGNTCKNTADGYDCTCAAPWKVGTDQCFKTGTGLSTKNGSSWDVLPQFRVACDVAFGDNDPCPSPGQLTWLNVCGLPDTMPNDCSAIAGNQSGLGVVTLRRVSYTGPLEQYGNPPTDGFTDRVVLPAVGDVILVQSLLSLYIMRITAVDAGMLSWDWAEVWRDTCWRPGGSSCTAACGCPGGN